MPQEITFIIPVRNNQKYAFQAYRSIRKYHPEEHYIVLLDDASTDKTWDWIQQTEKWDEKVIAYRNESGERVGHTVLYDKGVELAPTKIISILHSDMIITENYVKNILKHLKPLTVVSATRIEPPLHPPGPEKFVMNFGMEPEEFEKKQKEFLEFVTVKETEYADITSEGIFAPWTIYKEDFTSIGGHDLLFAPMELEDSDIFNRMFLNGYAFVQSRDALVYHMTCRGSRFKDGIEIEKEIPLLDGTIWYKPKDSQEYLELRQNKFREWWRKWHTNVLHDELMKPVVPGRYETAFVIHNCNLNLLEALEPWCDRIYVDEVFEIGRTQDYIEMERGKTMFDIDKRVMIIGHNDPIGENDIVLEFDARQLTQQYYSEVIQQLPLILDQAEGAGTFEYGIFKITINSLKKKDMIQPFFKNVF
jgi:glycosyltransferase involved in cell wall biosynthesis